MSKLKTTLYKPTFFYSVSNSSRSFFNSATSAFETLKVLRVGTITVKTAKCIDYSD